MKEHQGITIAMSREFNDMSIELCLFDVGDFNEIPRTWNDMSS